MQVNLIWEAHYIKYRMGNQSLYHMQVKDCKSSKKLFHNRIRIVWFGCKYSQFPHLLKRVDFDVIVDHLALTHIIKSKAEPASARIKRLLELISSYSFNLYYVKGKDMISS